MGFRIFSSFWTMSSAGINSDGQKLLLLLLSFMIEHISLQAPHSNLGANQKDLLNGFMNCWHTIKFIEVNETFTEQWTQMIENNEENKYETNQRRNTSSTHSHKYETFSSFQLTVLITGCIPFFLPQLFALLLLFLPEVCSFTILQKKYIYCLVL